MACWFSHCGHRLICAAVSHQVANKTSGRLPRNESQGLMQVKVGIHCTRICVINIITVWNAYTAIMQPFSVRLGTCNSDCLIGLPSRLTLSIGQQPVYTGGHSVHTSSVCACVCMCVYVCVCVYASHGKRHNVNLLCASSLSSVVLNFIWTFSPILAHQL